VFRNEIIKLLKTVFAPTDKTLLILRKWNLRKGEWEILKKLDYKESNKKIEDAKKYDCYNIIASNKFVDLLDIEFTIVDGCIFNDLVLNLDDETTLILDGEQIDLSKCKDI
ncbi:MAG: hypothetical protein ACYSSI_08850, partial [Planctomycetota bacterium]